MVILGKWPYNTYFKFILGYLGQLMTILGKWPWNSFSGLYWGTSGNWWQFWENDHIIALYRFHQGYLGNWYQFWGNDHKIAIHRFHQGCLGSWCQFCENWSLWRIILASSFGQINLMGFPTSLPWFRYNGLLITRGMTTLKQSCSGNFQHGENRGVEFCIPILISLRVHHPHHFIGQLFK